MNRTAPRVALIIASTRTNRLADLVAPWVHAQLQARPDLEVALIDIRETPALPFYDLPAAPAMARRHYTSAPERALGERLDAAAKNDYNSWPATASATRRASASAPRAQSPR